MTTFGDIRSLAQARPREDAWASLCQALATLDADELERTLPYVEDHLERWPDYIRQPDSSWFAGLEESVVTPLWSLARTVGPSGSAWSRGGWRLLWASPWAPYLRLLGLKGHTLTPSDLGRMFDARRSESLRGLVWSGAVEDLSWWCTERLPQLETLELYGAGLRSTDMREADEDALTRLTTLSLSYNQITDLAWVGPLRPGIKRLRFENNPVRDLEPLATGFVSLDSLYLGETRVGDEGAAVLARARGMDALRVLDLSATGLTDAGVHALLESSVLEGLDSLEVGRNALTDDAAVAMAASPALGRLRQLGVGSTQMTERGWRALAESQHLSKELRASFRVMLG